MISSVHYRRTLDSIGVRCPTALDQTFIGKNTESVTDHSRSDETGVRRERS
ncbi:hypothetical protein G9444_2952 [Rhodococcus erythropolis]|uniref:Uncharacterized protein n=1 Tax=Rhodococcus erythropolis TaxID=1833 RepID=A0A6G9CU16_RHOER|nr:hypothetical protein G9444_2952 [Rhodococcus erythropolis]